MIFDAQRTGHGSSSQFHAFLVAMIRRRGLRICLMVTSRQRWTFRGIIKRGVWVMAKGGLTDLSEADSAIGHDILELPILARNSSAANQSSRPHHTPQNLAS